MSTVIPLEAIARTAAGAAHKISADAKACPSTSSCGSAKDATAMPSEVWDKIKDHPCYSQEAHHHYARMHVAVAPACNVQCNYCNRKFDCANESRPGVVSERLTPDQAVRKVMAVAERLPQLSVVGIAGPGDGLANPAKTFETFRRIRDALPDIKLCLSTNGLALPDHVESIVALGIHHVTITINAVDPEIGASIYEWIGFEGRRWRGVEGAALLLRRQLEGLDALVAAGVLVKVNSVMIPGINDGHLKEVNAVVRARGVFLHNIMPLISDPAHGTYFGLSGQRGPSPAELQALQESLDGDANLMRHCRQCRADAIGMLGEDVNAEFSLDSLPEEIEVDGAKRVAYRRVIERERTQRRAALDDALTRLAHGPEGETLLVAACTKGGGRVNQHFGHAEEFHVYEVDRSGVRFVGIRRADRYCTGGDGDDDVLENAIRSLEGVGALVCAKIGRCPKQRLAEAGIAVSDAHAFDYIETAVAGHFLDVHAARTRAASA